MGITYYEFDRDIETLHLVPFNFIFAVCINCYRFIRHTFYPLGFEKELYAARTLGYTRALEHTMWRRSSIEAIEEAAFERGRQEGNKEGFRRGIFYRAGITYGDLENN